MPAVSIRERVYFRHQLIVKAYSDLIHVEGIVLYPETNIAYQDRNPVVDFRERAAEVNVPRSILARPFPGFAEHPPMELAEVEFVQRVSATHDPGIDWFGNYPAEELTPKEIVGRLAKAAEKERWAPSRFNHYRSLVSLSYRLGILNRKVTMNPARSVTHPREDNNRVRFLTDEEEKNLRKVVKKKWRNHLPELDLAINTGIRKGSQYGLTWDMVDWKSRELHIPRTKNEEPLHVPLNDAAISALKAVFESGNGKERVFTSAKTGEPLENGRHWFDDALVEAKLKNFHWHDLRHTFASRLRMKGAPLEDIADLLAHKSLTMTRRYAHLGPNKLHAVVSLLGSSDPTSDTEQTGQTATTSQVAVQ